MIDLKWIPHVNPQFRLQWEEAQNSYVLLYPEGMVKLNRPAGEILIRCDGETSVAKIIEELQNKFPSAKTIDEDVNAFLNDACQKKWLISE